MAVYAVLVRFANRDGECHPARETIAQRLNISVSTVKRAIKELEGAGLIAVTGRGDGELQISNLYTLLPLSHAKVSPTQPVRAAEPIAGLWDTLIGAVNDAGDHTSKLKALHRTWAHCFGTEAGITPAQMQQLVQAAGGDYALVARKTLSCAAGVAPPIRSPFGLVRVALTREAPNRQPQRRETGAVGYGTVKRNDDDLPF